MKQDIRWIPRFEHFDHAVSLLREPIESLSSLEKEGTIQRFNVTVELAWKTLKGYLENEGKVIDPVTLRNLLLRLHASDV